MLLDKSTSEVDSLLFEVSILYAAGAPLGDRLIQLKGLTTQAQWDRLKALLERADDLIFDSGLAVVSMAERVDARRTGRDDRLAPDKVAWLFEGALAARWNLVERDLALMGIDFARTCPNCDPLDNRPALE